MSGEPAAERATSFGAIAEDYDRWRTGPSPAVADWLLPAGARRVVDLGAGTGALTRTLVGRVPEVVAVEPDPRMRGVLERNVGPATVVEGRGERIPLDDASVDAVLVSSAWHWMDVEPTLREIARVLRPGGTLGVVWAGIDSGGDWFARVADRARQDPAGVSDRLLRRLAAQQLVDDDHRALRVPADAPFHEPEHAWLGWEQPLRIDELVGMLGTFSGVIVLPAEQRRQVLDDFCAVLERYGDFDDDGSAMLAFRASCWRTRRADP